MPGGATPGSRRIASKSERLPKASAAYDGRRSPDQWGNHRRGPTGAPARGGVGLLGLADGMVGGGVRDGGAAGGRAAAAVALGPRTRRLQPGLGSFLGDLRW